MEYLADFAALAVGVGIVAVLTEVSTEVIKKVIEGFVELTTMQKFYIALVFGMVYATLLGVSLFDRATSNDILFYLGTLMAGAIASRGANRAHEILDALRSLRK